MREKSGQYRAKVIDFGYSVRYVDDNDRLTLTGTERWNAPEHGSCVRLWTLSQAMNADRFSFGMLCLWLLFEPSLSGRTPLPQGLKVADTGFAEDTLYRKKRQLQTYARLLLASETALEEDERMALGEFFGLSLSEVPEQREISLLELLRKLDPHRYD
jgi:serine/threonine protein kinase